MTNHKHNLLKLDWQKQSHIKKIINNLNIENEDLEKKSKELLRLIFSLLALSQDDEFNSLLELGKNLLDRGYCEMNKITFIMKLDELINNNPLSNHKILNMNIIKEDDKAKK